MNIQIEGINALAAALAEVDVEKIVEPAMRAFAEQLRREMAAGALLNSMRYHGRPPVDTAAGYLPNMRPDGTFYPRRKPRSTG